MRLVILQFMEIMRLCGTVTIVNVLLFACGMKQWKNLQGKLCLDYKTGII